MSIYIERAEVTTREIEITLEIYGRKISGGDALSMYNMYVYSISQRYSNDPLRAPKTRESEAALRGYNLINVTPVPRHFSPVAYTHRAEFLHSTKQCNFLSLPVAS